MKKNTLVIALIMCYGVLASQELNLNKKQLNAKKIEIGIQIDGNLDEDAWTNSSIASNFVQRSPNPGAEPSQKSEIKVLYDNSGLYIGARLYESNPDSILRQVTQRDEIGNSDWFGLFIDSYRDGINGVYFLVTPAGVQVDAKITPQRNQNGNFEIIQGEDFNWDAVWESEIQVNADSWTVEIMIPYSAIRFPKTEEQIWHVNFGRMIRRSQELSYWNEVDPQENGFLNQAGYLKDIHDIKSPIRLQATPFIALYGQHHHDKTGDPKNSFGRSFNGGMDVKFGISDAFTLDMTLIPDFGEAQSDNQVLNLSPFEVRFDENRQFFTEGTELFNKGNLFYSRRVGGRPVKFWDVEEDLADDEEVIENPNQAQLYNATKISGRTKKGLGVGFFNATSGREVALIENSEGLRREFETNPLTNYNVLVLDQNLKNNSFVSLINTTVLRDGSYYDANVSGTVFTLRNKANSYSINGSAKLSQKYFTDDTDLGHAVNLGVNKTSGNFRFGAGYNLESDTYDINDLGFINNNNEQSWDLFLEYNIFKPFWNFNRAGIGLYQGYNRLQNPNVFTGYQVNMWVWANTKKFWNFNFWTNLSPFEGFDYFEPRQEGRYFRTPTESNLGFWIGSDTRKKLRMGINGNFTKFGDDNRYSLNIGLFPRYRVNDKLSLGFRIFNRLAKNEVGYATVLDNENADGDIIFGRRNRMTVENNANTDYAFNKNMTLSFRLRHFWTKVEYNSFHFLTDNGLLASTDYIGQHNANFNAFNIDMVYRWRFAPGSDVYIVWKNAILNSEDYLNGGYFDNLSGLFDNPQTNSISIKVIYFLDYLKLKGK